VARDVHSLAALAALLYNPKYFGFPTVAGRRRSGYDSLMPESSMQTESTVYRPLIVVAVATATLLAIPLVAMQFTDQVVWNAADFVIAGRTDPVNPTAVSEATVREWERDGLLSWWGYCEDMAATLQQHQQVAHDDVDKGKQVTVYVGQT